MDEANDATREDRLLLLAALGEPLPDDDPRAARAAADIAQLRDQVRGLGDALAGPPAPKPVPVPPRAPVPLRRRRSVRLAFGGLVAACGVSLATGMVWLLAHSGAMSGADSGAADKAASDGKAGPGNSKADLTPEGFVACSRIIADTRVLTVEPVPGTDMDRVTVRVTHYYKPQKGGPETFTFPMSHDVDPRPKPGDRPLITLPKGGGQPDNWAEGKDRERLRTMILKALPKSRTLTCDGRSGPGD
ncbi:hypothetical protein [Streptomyces sp. VRA16 Mangrove soil]|uniref:hypothetical protein n=1 Tax=Streptomyces sp. VRA16 Mangrove soil TaxID=2817434 RepID=UPI001A9D8D80|nr:hypothetical protein [Streptomyces sp. VRA16 Mangrove soil]MBO1334005.1 hypothetical protein [Streptomyces sp. VRA16 Mangrove soil]